MEEITGAEFLLREYDQGAKREARRLVPRRAAGNVSLQDKNYKLVVMKM